MKLPLVSKKTLLANIAYVQFGDQHDPNVIEHVEALFNNISEFRIKLVFDKQHTVSDGAIRGWLFAAPPSVPKRHAALSFLHRYFVWKNRPASEMQGLRRAYCEAILKFFVTVGALENQELMKVPPDRPISMGKAEGTSASHISVRMSSAQIGALVGNYQIIRPFIGADKKYVLEPMSIKYDSDGKKTIMRMYSHNQPRAMFMYIGNVILTTRYLFSIIQRQHEYDRESSAVRCVSIYSDQQSVGSEIITRHCLSGIMMRGVKGNSGERGPVAIPFVAIKLDADPADIGAPDFEYLHRYLRRMSRHSFVLIGEVSDEVEPIFSLCEEIMQNIMIKTVKYNCIKTLSPDNAADTIIPNATHAGEYEELWRVKVNEYFKEYDKRNKNNQSVL